MILRVPYIFPIFMSAITNIYAHSNQILKYSPREDALILLADSSADRVCDSPSSIGLFIIMKTTLYRNRHRLKLKLECFSHYCNGKIKCKHCSEADLNILSIDHIKNDGSAHREMVKGGIHFCQWLRNNNYPKGFQILCFSCQFLKQRNVWNLKNVTSVQKSYSKYKKSIKLKCLKHYGEKCAMCGEGDCDVLTLDHVNNDGAKHRRKTRKSGSAFYLMLQQKGFPDNPPLQTLCANCQWRKNARRPVNVYRDNLSLSVSKSLKLLQAKQKLYLLLLRINENELTPDEAGVALALSKDEQVRLLLNPKTKRKNQST